MPPGRRWRSPGCSRPPLPPSLFPDAPQIRKEPWIADGYRGSFRELDIGPRYRAEHRERHREPVVARRLDPPAWWPGRPLHVQVVATGVGVDTHRAQVGGDQFEPVALLHAQLAHLAERP